MPRSQRLRAYLGAAPRRTLAGLIVGGLAVGWLVAGCQSDTTETDEVEETANLALNDQPLRYQAAWLIDAEAVGADGPGFPFRYVEIVDTASGSYLIQSPDHVAVQGLDQVVFCAAIFRADPYCATIERADDAPPVLSYPAQLLKGWGPTRLYELANWREVSLAAATEPDAWHVRTDTVGGNRVECFTVIGETTAARTGFEICFVDDDLHLVASVDLQGDLVYEIDLVDYARRLEPDAFETGLEGFFEAKASLMDQLIELYPDIPAARPTPTPDPDAGSSVDPDS